MLSGASVRDPCSTGFSEPQFPHLEDGTNSLSAVGFSPVLGCGL